MLPSYHPQLGDRGGRGARGAHPNPNPTPTPNIDANPTPDPDQVREVRAGASGGGAVELREALAALAHAEQALG